jgi:hypothetical protein
VFTARPHGRQPTTAATGKASDTSCGDTAVTGSTVARFLSRVGTPVPDRGDDPGLSRRVLGPACRRCSHVLLHYLGRDEQARLRCPETATRSTRSIKQQRRAELVTKVPHVAPTRGIHARRSRPRRAGTAVNRPSVAVRGSRRLRRPSWPPGFRPLFVRGHRDTAPTALQGDTPRDREETARIAENPQLTGRFRSVWQVLCGRCWVRTNVG